MRQPRSELELEEEKDNSKPFILSALLKGHSDDIRGLTSSSTSTLYSCSRDGTARSWKRGSTGDWEHKDTFIGHEGFVNSICWIDGFLLTGGIDTCINVYKLDDSSSSTTSITSNESSPTSTSSTSIIPFQTLYGHSNNVCCLHAAGERLVSGSWDGTARVWNMKDFSERHVLIQGERISAVWDVLALDGIGFDDSVITASADTLIRLWRGNKVDVVFKGHTGAVRALARVTQEDGDLAASLFASASNDGSIRIWNLKGDAITVLEEHDDSFIYGLIAIPSDGDADGLASSGEEGLVRIWDSDDGDLEQEILVPALSVWTLTTLPNGDLVIGCSDDLIWIFTRDPKRAASAIVQQDYNARISERIKSKSSTSTLPLTESLSALSVSGSKEGAIKLVKVDDGTTHAYSWTEGEWVDEGELVEPPTTTTNGASVPKPKTKMIHDGQEYDFVFKIDIKDDEPALDLCINLDEDIEELVKEFVKKHELPESYQERIVEFVEMFIA